MVVLSTSSLYYLECSRVICKFILKKHLPTENKYVTEWNFPAAKPNKQIIKDFLRLLKVSRVFVKHFFAIGFRKGLMFYLCWGFFPLFWNMEHILPCKEIDMNFVNKFLQKYFHSIDGLKDKLLLYCIHKYSTQLKVWNICR